jgi:hypothetical protein
LEHISESKLSPFAEPFNLPKEREKHLLNQRQMVQQQQLQQNSQKLQTNLHGQEQHQEGEDANPLPKESDSTQSYLKAATVELKKRLAIGEQVKDSTSRTDGGNVEGNAIDSVKEPSAIYDPFPSLQTKPKMRQQKEGKTKVQMPKNEFRADEHKTLNKNPSRNKPKKPSTPKDDKTSSRGESAISIDDAKEYEQKNSTNNSSTESVLENANNQSEGQGTQIHFGSFPVQLPRKQTNKQHEIPTEPHVKLTSESSQTAMEKVKVPKMIPEIHSQTVAQETSVINTQDPNDETEINEPGINVAPTNTPYDTITQTSSVSKLLSNLPSKDSKQKVREEAQVMQEKKVTKIGKEIL